VVIKTYVSRSRTQVNSSIIVYLLLAYFSEYCLQAELDPDVTDIILDVVCYFKTNFLSGCSMLCHYSDTRTVQPVATCRQLPFVHKPAVVKLLLLIYSFQFRSAFRATTTPSRPRPLDTIACQVSSPRTDYAQPATDNALTSVTKALPTDS